MTHELFLASNDLIFLVASAAFLVNSHAQIAQNDKDDDLGR